MDHNKILIVFLVLVLQTMLNSGPAYSYSSLVSGKELLGFCRNFKNTQGEADYETVHCLGYIKGVVDGLSYEDAIENTQKYCLPKNLSSSQIAHIIIKYLREHPNELHYGASSTISGVLGSSFPCK